MARALVRALGAAGIEVRTASSLRTYSGTPDSDALHRLKASAGEEIARLLHADSQFASWRPDIWLTYHPYYKSPDWIGPEISRALKIPYATIEASYAAHRANGEWAAWHSENTMAIKAAALHFTMTARDREGLGNFSQLKAKLVYLPPFIELPTATQADASGPIDSAEPREPRIVTVAMMRPGVKLKSYRLLANALGRMTSDAWTLDIVGDGSARAEVEAAFRDALAGPPAVGRPNRLRWHGELGPGEVQNILRHGDIFAWPGFDEGYGLVYLEAGAAGMPVVAQRSGGVPAVVIDGKTGILTPEGDAAAFTQALQVLLHNAARRARLGGEAMRFVNDERSIASAADILRRELSALAHDR